MPDSSGIWTVSNQTLKRTEREWPSNFFHYIAHIQASCTGSNVCWQYLSNAALRVYNLRRLSTNLATNRLSGWLCRLFLQSTNWMFFVILNEKLKELEMGEIHTLHAGAVNFQLCLQSHPWCFTGMPSMKEEFIFIFSFSLGPLLLSSSFLFFQQYFSKTLFR